MYGKTCMAPDCEETRELEYRTDVDDPYGEKLVLCRTHTASYDRKCMDELEEWDPINPRKNRT